MKRGLLRDGGAGLCELCHPIVCCWPIGTALAILAKLRNECGKRTHRAEIVL